VREPETTLVLETLGGETLSHLIRRHRDRRLALPEVMALGTQLASVAYLHGHGVLHLDVKPANVIAEQGRAKLLDLSLVRRPGRGVRGRGTRPYLSPEQARGGAFTAATDVWGLGSVIYRALAGDTPFPLVEGPGHPQLDGRAPVGSHPGVGYPARWPRWWMPAWSPSRRSGPPSRRSQR